ncbi:MAG: HEPN domain-containing protein [Deltaproteobacteria bacterium]|nr:HEPN domain-containing protein [Deltaproteobacteria bacterium]
MKPVDHLNKIVQLAELGLVPEKIGTAYKIFRIGGDGVSFFIEDMIDYEESLKALFQHDKSVHDTYTLERFEQEIIKFLDKNFTTKESVDEGGSLSFFAGLTSAPISEFSVLRDVHGIILRQLENPYAIGPFTIYHFSSHQEILNSKTSLAAGGLWTDENPDYLIEAVIKARHHEKALEIADRLFEKFELLLRFAIGFNANRFEVGVLNYQGWRHRRAYIFSKDGSASSSHSGHGAYKPIPIDDPYFVSTEAGFDLMWAALASTNTTELQKRVLLAIEWIGQSYNELSPPSAFLKAAIALEILFSQDEKTIINASILSRIAESVALILGDCSAKRLKIEKEMKKLYSMRSAIAHAGKSEIAQEDLLTIFYFSSTVVMKVMTSSSQMGWNSIADVHSCLKSLKFSCPEI